MSYGFLLSASATAGIVLVGTPLAEYLGRVLPSLLAEVVAILLAAQMACLPVLALFTDTGSIWGVLANALVAPVVAPLTISGLAVAHLPGCPRCRAVSASTRPHVYMVDRYRGMNPSPAGPARVSASRGQGCSAWL